MTVNQDNLTIKGMRVVRTIPGECTGENLYQTQDGKIWKETSNYNTGVETLIKRN